MVDMFHFLFFYEYIEIRNTTAAKWALHFLSLFVNAADIFRRVRTWFTLTFIIFYIFILKTDELVEGDLILACKDLWSLVIHAYYGVVDRFLSEW